MTRIAIAAWVVFSLAICSGQMIAQQSDTQAKKTSRLQTWHDPDLPDSMRIKAFRDLIWKDYLFSRPDTAFLMASELLNFSEQCDNSFGKILSNNMMGISKNILGDLEAAEEYQLENLRISQEVRDTQFISFAYNNLGIIYRKKGDLTNAIDVSERGVNLDRVRHDTIGLVRSLQNLGNIFLQQGMFPRALSIFNEGISLAGQDTDPSVLAGLTHGVGLIYERQGDLDMALEYYGRARNSYESANDKGGLGALDNSIGIVYDQKEMHDSAIANYQRGLEYGREIQDVNLVADILINLGIAFLNNKEHDSALKNLNEALELNRRMGFKKGVTAALNNIGIALGEQGNYSAAIDSCTAALKIGEETGSLISQESSCSCLYVQFRAAGNTDKALAFHERLNKIQDTLKSRKITKELNQMELRKQLTADSIERAEELEQISQAHEKEVKKESTSRNLALGSGLLLLLLAVGLIRRNKHIQRSKELVEEDRNRSETLLLNMLPADVAEELKLHGKSEPREFDNVTVLFTDFVKFTETSAQFAPTELVAEINICFGVFDSICKKFNIEKIKTIGDAYMAAGGLPVSTEKDASNVILAAIEMQEFIMSRRKSQLERGKPSFEMRVGIHTGPVVAGIVGTSKLQYDIWGDTVNTASRMESHGQVGSVNISEMTYALVNKDPKFEVEDRGSTEVKGKGDMQMYFVSQSSV